ncbi:MAG: biopolymer transporter ExbD [Proteobacteria bacterium]|nr:biopolymer transporter ExbD [Pseudomonadota bacterium]
MSEINMTPLIDIVLVVLIIMMVSIPVELEQMGVKVPGPPPPTPPTMPEDAPEQLVIAVYQDGTFGLNRRLMAREKMLYEVTRRLVPLQKKNVFIDAHLEVPFSLVVEMMDLAKAAGAEKVGLAKVKDSGPLAATSVDQGAAPRGLQRGTPKPVGAMSTPKADKALQPLLATLEGCYYKELGANPQLSGTVNYKVDVYPDGSVVSVTVGHSTLDNDTVESCSVQALSELMKFEPLGGPDKTAAILYPILYSPG